MEIKKLISSEIINDAIKFNALNSIKINDDQFINYDSLISFIDNDLEEIEVYDFN